MPTIVPEQYAVVVSTGAIRTALGLTGDDALAVRDVAGSYRSVRDGDRFVLCFTGVAPARIAVEVTAKGASAATAHEVPLGDVAFSRAAPADSARRVDPTRPFLLAVAGTLVSSVAILVAAFAGISGKDAGGPYQSVLAEVMVWMAAVIVVATVAALLLQVVRVAWMWTQGDAGPRGWTPARAVLLAVCLIVSAAPVYYGWFAARAAVHGGMTALKWIKPPPAAVPPTAVPPAAAPPVETPPAAVPPAGVPWPLRVFE